MMELNRNWKQTFTVEKVLSVAKCGFERCANISVLTCSSLDVDDGTCSAAEADGEVTERTFTAVVTRMSGADSVANHPINVDAFRFSGHDWYLLYCNISVHSQKHVGSGDQQQILSLLK